MKKTLIFLFTIYALSLSAQDVSVEARCPSTVNAGQQFSVTWTVSTSTGGEFTPPSLNPFNVLAGPMSSYSSSTQIINGRRTQSTSYAYVYYLQASQAGKFVIPPAVFTQNNKKYSSDSLYIEVVGGNAAQSSSALNNSGNQQVGTNEDIYISIILNKREAYIGEPVIATIKLFTRIYIRGINNIKYPQFDGFFSIDLDMLQKTAYDQENVGGTIYRTLILNQFLLYPQKTGEIVIDPAQVTFYGRNYERPVIESKPVRIRINPLPGNQPSDYSGIVGKLDIKSSINKDTVIVNDAISFKITISGSGNLKIAAAPTLKLSPDIEIYNPTATDNIKNGVNGTTGSKSFEYLLIPRYHGDFTIPPVTYSYFNASSGKFEQLKTPEYRFYAKKDADADSNVNVFGGRPKIDVSVGKDIRFIKSDVGKLTKIETGLIANRTYQSLYLLAILSFLIILFIRREHVKRNADISKVRNRKAGKIARKRLKNADICLKNNQFDKLYEEILKALWGYFSDKLNIPQADLTKTRIAFALSEKKIDETIIEKLNEILDRCEYARFAPSSSETEATSLYEGASQIIKTVENTII
jgi:hypothetical protein